jgi:Rad3-related DNA helicase
VAEPGIRTYLANLPNPSSDDASAKDIRRYNYTKSLLEKVELLARELPEGGWVYDGYKYDDVIFRPIKTARYGDQLLWNHGRKFLCMSATILSADLMVEELGICYTHNRPYTTIEVPSNYPVENRPIHVAPVANMVYKEKLTAWPSMIAGLRGVLNLHPDERILVHCVSYELARYLVAGVKDANRPIITYYGSAHKAKALRDYAATHNSVMIAASMDRGIDLPDDMCRVQVVAKIPWPNTADKRINARMYSKGGSAWYAMHAVRTLIQMTGRGIRSPEDHAETYILDAQFGENLYKHEYLFPKWWKEALNWRFNKRKLVR